MRIENETLVITDPCYVKSGVEPLINESTIYGDWSCMAYKTSKEEAIRLSEEWNKIYFKFYNKYNFSELSEDERKILSEQFDKDKEEWIKKYCYGEFCADSGQVAVFRLSDIKKTCPEFCDWAKKHTWCVTFVPDYTGDIEYVVSNDEDAHIVGNNLYTTQSGL